MSPCTCHATGSQTYCTKRISIPILEAEILVLHRMESELAKSSLRRKHASLIEARRRVTRADVRARNMAESTTTAAHAAGSKMGDVVRPLDLMSLAKASREEERANEAKAARDWKTKRFSANSSTLMLSCTSITSLPPPTSSRAALVPGPLRIRKVSPAYASPSSSSPTLQSNYTMDDLRAEFRREVKELRDLMKK